MIIWPFISTNIYKAFKSVRKNVVCKITMAYIKMKIDLDQVNSLLTSIHLKIWPISTLLSDCYNTKSLSKVQNKTKKKGAATLPWQVSQTKQAYLPNILNKNSLECFTNIWNTLRFLLSWFRYKKIKSVL